MSYEHWSIDQECGKRCWPSFLSDQPTVYFPPGTWFRLIILIVLFSIVVLSFFITIQPFGAIQNPQYLVKYILQPYATFPDITACQRSTEVFNVVSCELPGTGSCMAMWVNSTLALNGNILKCVTTKFNGNVRLDNQGLLNGNELIITFNITDTINSNAWTGLSIFFQSIPIDIEHYNNRYAIQAGTSLLMSLQTTEVDDIIDYDAKVETVNNIVGSTNGLGIAILDIHFRTLIMINSEKQGVPAHLWTLASPWAGILSIFPTISIGVMLVLATLFKPCCACELNESDGSSCGFTCDQTKRL